MTFGKTIITVSTYYILKDAFLLLLTQVRNLFLGWDILLLVENNKTNVAQYEIAKKMVAASQF